MTRFQKHCLLLRSASKMMKQLEHSWWSLVGSLTNVNEAHKNSPSMMLMDANFYFNYV